MKWFSRRWLPIFATSLVIAIVVAASGSIVALTISDAFQDLRVLKQALVIYQSKNGSLPDELTALEDQPGKPGILPKLRPDPWGNQYIYRRVPSSLGYLLYSTGVDGVDDSGQGDDVTDSPKQYSCADYGMNCPPTARAIVAYAAAAIALVSLLFGVVRLVMRSNNALERARNG